MIIEDDLQDANFTIRALKQASQNLTYFHLSDVEELAQFDYDAHPVDLILMDMKMPKLSGIELLKSIKENPKSAQIPIVVLSSSQMPKEKQEAQQLGIYDFIIKPINIEQYYEVVKQAYINVFNEFRN